MEQAALGGAGIESGSPMIQAQRADRFVGVGHEMAGRLASFVAENIRRDGFLSDFQAVIGEPVDPHPTVAVHARQRLERKPFGGGSELGLAENLSGEGPLAGLIEARGQAGLLQGQGAIAPQDGEGQGSVERGPDRFGVRIFPRR